MLDSIRCELHLRLDELFTGATVDELVGDTEGYRAKLMKIAEVSGVLGVCTEITYLKINLSEGTKKASCLPKPD